MRPPIPSVIFSRRAKIALSVVVILIVLLILLVKFSGVYINFLWYGSLGHRNVYSTMFWTKVSLFFIFGVLMALIIGGNLVAAYLIKPPFRPMSPEQQNLQHYVAMVEPRRKLILGGVMAIALIAAGASAQGKWSEWQMFLNGTAFGQQDPQFHRDIGFYVWDYPVYRILLSFGFAAIIFSIILSVGVHYLTGAIRLQTPGPKITISARRHLTILVFVFMALKAVAYWLDRYGFVFSSRSKFTGASYTDVHSALPAKTILFWITILLALGVLASMWLRSALLPGIGFVVLLVLSILIGGIYPAIVQQVSVKPNASDKEKPYISRNITATRQAYGIVTADTADPSGTVTYKSYPAVSTPARSAITDANTTVDNIRILDPNLIAPTFTAQQKIAQPYGFSTPLNVDRYTVKDPTTGKVAEHDYVVGAREQVPANLTGSQNNWINQHTVYTHGYGFVAAQADEDVTNGAPYTEGEIPPSGPLKISQPEIYYGQGMNEYSIVGAKGKAREYNGNQGNNTYTGTGGVSLSNPITKLALAIKYKETNFVLNDAVGASGAKIIFNRDPKTMVQKVAPFLTVDGAPYPFVDQKTGHIMWMVDGYTTTANFPYSERQSLSELTGTSLRKDQKDTQINYIRNSVKATVDAFSGKVTLYDWDQTDPVLKTWMKIYPGLVKPKKDMPAAVEDHVRYPQDLFNVQRSLLAQYHISDPVKSYNGNGKWQVPADPFNQSAGDQPAYYVLANSPTGTSNSPEFQLTTPMVVNNANNLAAYISVNSDNGPDYGKFTVLQMPTSATIQGPSIVANDFKSEAQISKDITQLNSTQSNVLHGNLLTLPLGDSFLYVEPLYVQSDSAGAFPTLQRVLVRYGGEIGYEATLDDALGDIQQNRQPGSLLATLGQSSGSGTKTPTPSSSASSSSAPSTSAAPSSGAPGTSVDSLLTQLAQAKAALAAAYDTKDPVKIAQAQAAESKLVDQLLAATTPPAAPKSTPKPTATKTK